MQTPSITRFADITGEYITAYLPLEPGQDCTAQVQALNRILSPHGIRLNIIEETTKKKSTLSVFIAHKSLSRKAGRKTKTCIKDRTTQTPYTVLDVQNMEKQGMKACDIAAALRISRSSYYERKKKAKDKKPEDIF